MKIIKIKTINTYKKIAKKFQKNNNNKKKRAANKVKTIVH